MNFFYETSCILLLLWIIEILVYEVISRKEENVKIIEIFC